MVPQRISSALSQLPLLPCPRTLHSFHLSAPRAEKGIRNEYSRLEGWM